MQYETMLRFILLNLLICIEFSLGHNDSISIKTYAKVATWGASNKSESIGEGRSNGQTLFTQRSDVKVTSGQNIRPFYSSSSKVGYDTNNLPGKGEVILERFNPRPYFDYMAEGHKHHNHQPDKTKIVYAASADSSASQEVDVKPSSLYDSPISSYNPIASGIPSYNKPLSSYQPQPAGLPDNVKVQTSGPLYPPNDNKPDIIYAAPNKPKMKFPSYLYDNPLKDDSKSSEMAPFPPYVYGSPAMMDMKKPMDNSMPPGPYAPPADDGDQEEGPPITPTVAPPNDNDDQDSYMDDHHQHHHHHHEQEYDMPPDNNNQDDSDMMMPPTAPEHHHHHHHDDNQSDDFPKNIPEYLDHDPTGKFPYYNYDDFHHHPPIYHEIKHTTQSTTTEAAEDERVNKGHYSYYYLGRKLWYIPLYFSVYFMVYITILILKSIARHKVTFAHDLQDMKGRSLNDNSQNVDDITEQVTQSIQHFKAKYYAM